MKKLCMSALTIRYASDLQRQHELVSRVFRLGWGRTETPEIVIASLRQARSMEGLWNGNVQRRIRRYTVVRDHCNPHIIYREIYTAYTPKLALEAILFSFHPRTGGKVD